MYCAFPFVFHVQNNKNSKTKLHFYYSEDRDRPKSRPKRDHRGPPAGPARWTIFGP